MSALVIDNGSWTIKAGVVGEDAPTAVVRTVIGRLRSSISSLSAAAQFNDFYIGDEAEIKRGILSLKHPLRKGIVDNWEDMEKVWHHTFHNELKVKPEEHQVLLTEAPFTPKADREKMAQIMFETFKTPGIFVAMPQVLSLYTAGQTTGLVVESGFDASHTVPVHDGFAVSEAIGHLDFGGFDLTFFLQKMLMLRYNFTTNLQHKVFGGCKENSCYVALDFDQEMQKEMPDPSPEHTYTLPDQQVITLRNERFRCPEALFQPSLFESDTAQGIHLLTQESIMKSGLELRRNLYGTIVLAGGSTLFPGFADRLQKEVTALAPPGGMKVKVVAPQYRNFSAWIGGSILGSHSSLKEMWISKQEYEESGPSIVHRCGTK